MESIAARSILLSRLLACRAEDSGESTIGLERILFESRRDGFCNKAESLEALSQRLLSAPDLEEPHAVLRLLIALAHSETLPSRILSSAGRRVLDAYSRAPPGHFFPSSLVAEKPLVDGSATRPGSVGAHSA